MRRAAASALPLLLVLALSAGGAFGVYRAAVRAMAEQAARQDAAYAAGLEAALERALASRDVEIRRLGARVDEQWREFYETLAARQPVIGKGKGGIESR